MKVHFHQVLVFLFILVATIIPVAAITAGNGSYSGGAVGTVQSSTETYVPTTYQTIAVPTIDVPQNIGIVPIWLIIGIILIIIALAGLVWRYLHPKYVAPEEDK